MITSGTCCPSVSEPESRPDHGLMNGVTVFCWDPRIDGVSGIDDWLIENSITTTHCAPSFLRAWSDLDCDAANDDSIGSLRVVVTYGGEAVHGEDYARHRSHGFARVTYVNWLATTETGVVAYNAFPPHSELPVGVVPAGRARDGKDVQIVDVNGVPLPDGEIGEIQVVSSDLADGYHGDPDRTATRFTRLGDGVSIYRTGDRGPHRRTRRTATSGDASTTPSRFGGATWWNRWKSRRIFVEFPASPMFSWPSSSRTIDRRSSPTWS